MGNRAAQIRAAIQAAHPGATVRARGRNWIEHQLPDGRVSLDVSIDALHYNVDQEIDTTVADSNVGEFDDMVVTTPYRFYQKDGVRRIYPRRDVMTEWIELGLPEFQRANLTWALIPWTGKQRSDNVITLTRPDAQLQVSFGGGRLKMNLILLSTPSATRWRFPISLQGLTRQGANLIADSDGIVAATVAPFTLSDSSQPSIQRDVAGQLTAHPTYQGAYQVEPNLSGLTYPVLIDPTIDISVVNNADDGYWLNPSTFDAAAIVAAYGRFNSTASYRSFARFTNITIGAGSTIDVAYITGVSGFNRAVTTVNVRISANAADNPTAPTTYADADGRALTTATVDWNNVPAHTQGVAYNTPSIVTIAQELVDRGGWASGNAMLFFIKDNGSTTDGAVRDFATLEHTTLAPPLLHIEYTPAATGNSHYYYQMQVNQ